MHRRQFLAAALLFPASSVRAAQAIATPAATPNHHGRPRPILLGDGIELVDYRIYPSSDVPRIIGEIISTRDDMADSPVVSITFPELREEGLAWATPVLPVMRPGESNMIFGVLPNGIAFNAQLEAASFGLCSSVRSGAFSDRFAKTDFSFAFTEESYWQRSLNVRGIATNNGPGPIEYTAIQGIVRDNNDRYVGAIPRAHAGHFQSGQTKDFFLWASTDHPTLADPYSMLAEETPYNVEVHMSIVDFYTSLACPSAIS